MFDEKRRTEGRQFRMLMLYEVPKGRPPQTTDVLLLEMVLDIKGQKGY